MKQSFSAREASSRGQALTILGMLLFCVPLIWTGLRRAEFDGRPAARRDSVTGVPVDHNLIVTWQGSRLNDPRIDEIRTVLCGELASDGLLRGGSPYVAEVVSARDALDSLLAADMPVERATNSLAGLWLGRGGLKIKATASGRRDLDWTARRIAAELNAVPGREVTIEQRSLTTPIVGESRSADEIPDYDLEVFCASSGDPLSTPATLREEVLRVRGYPTSGEPEGQRLVDEAFTAIGTPIALRIRLTEAGVAEPEAAGRAVRCAAVAAGVPEEDLLVTGSLLAASERAEMLRGAIWGQGGAAPGASSPMVIAILLAGVLAVVLGGYSIDLVCSVLLGAFGAAAIAAGMNALGIAWNEALLLIPVLTFVLTVATALLEPPTGESIIARVRKPMSASTMLCALCLVTLLAGSNMQRAGDRQFALAGAAACALAWILSTICVPQIALLLGARPVRRATYGLDFAEWIVSHHRITATVAAGIGIVAGVVLMQPSVQNWVSAPQETLASSAQFQTERALTGTSDLRAEIRFDAERTQRLRFLERAGIVRQTLEKLKGVHGVTGAMSLAVAAPDIPRPAEDAKTRERTAYLSQSNQVAQRLRDQNAAMGGDWILGGDGDEASDSSGETWVIKASVAELSATAPGDMVAALHRSIQEVLRFHAGVSHELSGDLVSAAVQNSTPSRRPGVIGALAVLSLVLSAVGAGSLARGLVLAAVVAFPGLAILLAPGFRPESLGAPAYLCVAASLGLGLLSCIRLVNDLRDWSAATATRHEAIAFALTGLAHRSRQALVTLTAVFGVLSVLAPQLMPGTIRAGVWSAAWSMIASLAIFPLLASGRLGRLIVRDAERSLDVQDDALVTAPIRLEPVVEAPHFELESVRRRVRNAG